MEYQEQLRRLVLGDESFIRLVLALGPGSVEASHLDPKTHALVRLAGQLGADAPPACYQHVVAVALAAGATVVLASHEDDRAGRLASRTVEIRGGVVVAPDPEAARAP